MRTLFWRWLQYLGSIGFTIILLLLLLLLVIIGTLEQKVIGLYQAQQKYFYSWICFFPSSSLIQIPFPGGALLFGLLFFNLLSSFIVKFKRTWSKIGLWICHIGLVCLLFGSFLTFQFSKRGELILEPEQISNCVVDHEEFVLQLIDTSATEFDSVYSFPKSSLQPGQRLTAQGCAIHLKVQQKNSQSYLIEVWAEHTKIANLTIPETVENWQVINYQNRQYKISMNYKQWSLPFQVQLEYFTREEHPGTKIAQNFESKINIIEKDYEQEARIRMNHPLRYRGYTFYQNSYKLSAQNQNVYASVLAVVYNPAELWPYFSCIIILLGMIIHFILKMIVFLRKPNHQIINCFL